MTTQRAWGAEIQTGNKLSNGPQRVQRNKVFCNVRHTSVVRDMQVSRKRTGQTVKSRWHRG